MEMREEFESALLAEALKTEPGCGLTLAAIEENREGDRYAAPSMEFAWWAWQASRAAVVVELPMAYGNDGFDNIEPMPETGYLYFRDDVVAAIEAAGLKVVP